MEQITKMADIVTYKNGNYTVILDRNDGTMIRYTKDNELRPEFPDSMDVKITNRCDRGCLWCHEKSSLNGADANWSSLEKFIVGLPKYTQLALGGGNVLEYFWLSDLLLLCKEQELIPSITVNQAHFMNKAEQLFLKSASREKLLYGLGVSLNKATSDFIEAIEEFPNAVIHVIAGLVTVEELEKLANRNLKILILGYKEFGRGTNYFTENSKDIVSNLYSLMDNLPRMIKQKWFTNISFDNLALEQLHVRQILSEEKWNEFYMGADGVSTMYVDMVNEQFARSSTSDTRYPLLEDVREMLDVIHKERE